MAAEYTDEMHAGGAAALAARLARGRPLLLDGATGTELERRGIPTGLPLWSTHALLAEPRAVAEIHRSYVEAGAEIVTANTFRTQRRVLAAAGLGARARDLTQLAVRLARESGARWVAGSAPPLADCYRPDLAPDDTALASEHTDHAQALAAAGVDLLLVETHNSLREARHALRAARATGLPVWVSFVSWQRGELLSGEPLAAAVALAAEEGAGSVGVNCLPPSAVPACLEILAAGDLPFGVYANLGEPEDSTGFRRSHACSPEELAAHARAWLAAGARWIGGCCGTGPDQLAALARAITSHARRA